MARIAGVAMPSVPHHVTHVTQRRNRREPVFLRSRGIVHLIVTPADENAAADLWRSAPPLHRGYQRAVQLSRPSFQGRFTAMVMDEPHLLAAARYIALNPVVAGLVSYPGDWPWSSARTHLAGDDDELATVAPLRALIPDFVALLAAPADPATTARIERAPTSARPLGAPEWIAALEQRLRRPFPANPDQSREWTVSPSSSSGCCRFR